MQDYNEQSPSLRVIRMGQTKVFPAENQGSISVCDHVNIALFLNDIRLCKLCTYVTYDTYICYLCNFNLSCGRPARTRVPCVTKIFLCFELTLSYAIYVRILVT